MIHLLEKLISIPSVSRDEKNAVDFLEGYLYSIGLTPHRLMNNLWVESEPQSDKPTILLNAHIDTVKPSTNYTRDPFTPFFDGEKLYGLGSNDDGGSLVALLQAYLDLIRKKQPYRLVYSVTAQEEVGGREGISSIFDKIGKIDLGIIGEPTSMRMAVAEKGLMVLDCTAYGQSGHAARNEGVNAIYNAITDIEWFNKYQFEKVSDFCGEVKMSVTQINAGSQHNVVPDRCNFVVDIRGNGLYNNLEILKIVAENVTCEFKPRTTHHNGASIHIEHPIVKRGLLLGLEPFGSPTSSNQSECLFNTIKIGPGDSARSHTADEFIKSSEIYEGIDIYFKLLNGLEL